MGHYLAKAKEMMRTVRLTLVLSLLCPVFSLVVLLPQSSPRPFSSSPRVLSSSPLSARVLPSSPPLFLVSRFLRPRSLDACLSPSSCGLQQGLKHLGRAPSSASDANASNRFVPQHPSAQSHHAVTFSNDSDDPSP
eukprot:3861660-Rhodomonas_salina.4